MSKFSYPIESEDHDNVNNPSHYQGKVECIDCIESVLVIIKVKLNVLTALRVQQLDLTALKPFVLEMPSSIYIVGKRKTALKT